MCHWMFGSPDPNRFGPRCEADADADPMLLEAQHAPRIDAALVVERLALSLGDQPGRYEDHTPAHRPRLTLHR